MNDPKKKNEVLVLVALLAVLVIVAIIFAPGLMPAKPLPGSSVKPVTAADSHANKPQTAAGSTESSKAENGNPLGWIDPRRVDSIIGEVKANNPFVDKLAPVIITPPIGPISPIPPINPNHPPYVPSGTSLPLPKAPPAFALRGVLVWDHIPAATIALEGDGYSTFHVGETVFDTGWTVKKISPEYSQVTLTKSGYQPVSLRQAGGSQK